MKVLVLLLSLALLAGCSAGGWETVSDDIPDEAAAVWQEEAFSIVTSLPQGAALVAEEDGLKRYRVEETGLELEERVFLSHSLDSAVRQLTGLSEDEVTVVETTRFNLPEYQFAWYDADTGRLARADLVMDGMTCYALVCSTPEAEGAALGQEARAAFAGFGLYYDEQA